MGSHECLICCGELIDTLFNADHANILCRLLRLPLSSSSPFCSMFQSSTYCPSCVRSFNSILKIFSDLTELEYKLEESRKTIEVQLKRSFKVGKNSTMGLKVQDLDPLTISNQFVRELVILELSKSDSANIFIHYQHLEQVSTIKTEFGEEELPYPSHVNINVEQLSDPPSPTLSFNSSQCLDEKFMPSPSSPEEAPDQYNMDMDIPKNKTVTTLKHTQTRVRSLRLRNQNQKTMKKTRNPTKPRVNKRVALRVSCPYSDKCKIKINSGDEIRIEAHFRQYHEGLREIYICKICDERFRSYKSLILHQTNSHTVEINVSSMNNQKAQEEDTPQDFNENTVPPTGISMNKELESASPTHSEIHNTRLASDSSSSQPRAKHRYRNRLGSRVRCPFFEDCKIKINNNDEVRIEAHFRQFHEGIRNHYICKICDQSFRSYKRLMLHQTESHTVEAVDASMTTTQDLNDDLFSKRSDSIFESELLELNEPTYPEFLSDNIIFDSKDVDGDVQQELKRSRNQNKRKGVKVETQFEDQQPTNSKRKRIPLRVLKRRIKCPIEGCKYKFYPEEEFRRQAHVRKYHEGMKYCFRCETCNIYFHNIGQWRKHNSEHTGIPAFICKYCQTECKNQYALRLHTKIKHKQSSKKLVCNDCGKTFEYKGIYERHLRMHKKERPYMCEICSETFTEEKYLKYHQTKHKESGLDPFQCHICGKQYAAPNNVKVHIRMVHTKEHRHMCDFPGCKSGTQSKSALHKHFLARHTDERNFKCQLCESTFKFEQCLTLHMRRHINIRKHKCQTCGKAFVMKTGLQRHELIHSGAQCHVCEICGKQFPVRNYLYIHMRSHNKTNRKRKI